MPKHIDISIKKQALLLTIIFSILACLIWGGLAVSLLKTPIGGWLRDTISLVTSKLESSSSVLDDSAGEYGADSIAVTPIMETLVSGSMAELSGIVAATIDVYPYELFLYPVSQKNRLPDDFPTKTAQLPLVQVGEVSVAELIKDPLLELISAAKSAGYSPYLRSGFRSIVDQHTAFSRYVTEGTASGRSVEEARVFAMQFSAEPGYSEHHLGLAVDLLDYYYADWSVARRNYDKGLYLWLRQYAHEYGFVISYPAGADGTHSKEGSGYSLSEPWHLRFLGVELAGWLFRNGYLSIHSDVTVNEVLIEIQDMNGAGR